MNKSKSVIIAILLLTGVLNYAQEQPNVIVILADDIGVGDLSHYRKRHSQKIVVETPALDQLAKEGMLFTDAHSPAALCAPSRYAIMIGNNCYRSYAPWGVWGSYQPSPIEPNQITLGKLMKNAGYSTAFFGKWGFGMDFYSKGDNTKIYKGPRQKIELDVDIRKIAGKGPIANGFDYSFLFPSGIQNVPYAVYENEKWLPLTNNSEITLITQKKMDALGVKLDKDEGLGDSAWNPHLMGPLLVNKAVDFIKASDRKKPFFMYYCSLAVHLPHTPSKTLNGQPIANTTPSAHLDMVKELDVQIAMLVETLKKKGIYKNTLIVFTSDNGGLLNAKTNSSGHRSNAIYRGGKNQPYEGGHRVPFIASWPGKIKPQTVSRTPILGLDILGTLAAVTNQELQESEAPDSANLLPIFLQENNKNVHQYLINQSGTGKEVMITKDGWKLIIAYARKNSPRKPIALFNLKKNTKEQEQFNLISNPNQASRINDLFSTYNQIRNSRVGTKL